MLFLHTETKNTLGNMLNVFFIKIKAKVFILVMSSLAQGVKKSGGKIIAGKGATFYAIAAAVCKIVDCVVSNKEMVLPLSVMLDGEYGISDVCLGLPCKVGGNGLGEKMPLDLNETEIEALQNSANILKNIFSGVEF